MLSPYGEARVSMRLSMQFQSSEREERRPAQTSVIVPAIDCGPKAWHSRRRGLEAIPSRPVHAPERGPCRPCHCSSIVEVQVVSPR